MKKEERKKKEERRRRKNWRKLDVGVITVVMNYLITLQESGSFMYFGRRECLRGEGGFVVVFFSFSFFFSFFFINKNKNKYVILFILSFVIVQI